MTKSDCKAIAPEYPGMDQLLEAMVKHKQYMFAKYENIITDVEVKQNSRHNYNITVRTMIFSGGIRIKDI